jgi:hypothetical protein
LTTPTYNDPFGLLCLKKTAELANGAFTSLEPISPPQRSRYTPTGEDATIELGLDVAQVVLAVLFGVVNTFSYDAGSKKAASRCAQVAAARSTTTAAASV